MTGTLRQWIRGAQLLGVMYLPRPLRRGFSAVCERLDGWLKAAEKRAGESKWGR